MMTMSLTTKGTRLIMTAREESREAGRWGSPTWSDAFLAGGKGMVSHWRRGEGYFLLMQQPTVAIADANRGRKPNMIECIPGRGGGVDDDAQGRGEKGGRGRRFLEEEWTNGL